MTTYVLDTSGIIRSVQRHAGGGRVEEILAQSNSGSCNVVISAINWGEVRYTLVRLIGVDEAERAASAFLQFGLAIIPVTRDRAERAALLKQHFKIGYADCFGIELASDSPDHILVTADYGVKPAEQLIHIEFLPTKKLPDPCPPPPSSSS